MGTEDPDTERMHQLLGTALDDADLEADLVPAVLTGYGHQVRVRRYQAAGVALAVLATAGAGISVLPRGGHSNSESRVTSVAPRLPDYCRHQQWAETSKTGVQTSQQLSQNPAAEQANCEALQTALRSVYPYAELLPAYTSELTRDPRVDQAQVKKIEAEGHTDPTHYNADMAKNFGDELKYLADHPDDPANVFTPGSYALITPAGRETIVVGLENGKPAYGLPDIGVQAIDSIDCGKAPAALHSHYQCAQVGAADAWHGTLWKALDAADGPWRTAGIVTDQRGQHVEFFAMGQDRDAWYREGEYVTGLPLTLESVKTMPTWINRWTKETSKSWTPPSSRAMSQQQWAQFLTSPALKKYADGYLDYLKTKPETPSGQ